METKKLKERTLKKLVSFLPKIEAENKINKHFDYVDRIYNEDKDLTPKLAVEIMMSLH